MPFRVQHDNARDSGDRVNAAGCIGTVHVLIPFKGVLKRVRGDLPDVGSYCTTAHVMETRHVIGQESAEAIVGMEAAILDGMVDGNEPGE